MLRWYQMLTLTLLMVVTCLLIASLPISFTLIDYGKLIEARWEEPEHELEEGEEEDRAAVIKFDANPYIGWWWLIIPAALILGTAYITYGSHLIEEHSPEDSFFVGGPILFQFILVVASIVLGIVNSYYFDVPTRLAEAIGDEALAQKAVSEYRAIQVSLTIATLGLFLVCDVVILVLTLCLGVIIEKYTGYKQALAPALQGGGSHALVLRSDGVFERVRYVYRFRWLPFPAIVPERLVIDELHGSWAASFLASVSEADTELMCRQFKISLAELFDTVGTKMSDSTVSVIEKEVSSRRNKRLTQMVAGDTFRKATTLLQSTSDKTLSYFQQELLARMDTAVHAHLDDFRSRATVFMESVVARESVVISSQGQVFPDGTHYCLSQGDATVFVIEEQPQTRTVTFRRGFGVCESDSQRERYEYVLKEDTGFYLSFPYVIFVVKLVGQKFSDLCVYYTKEPLHSLSDTLYLVNLPNIHPGGDTCLRFSRETTATSTAQYVQMVISHFWQSRFNNDLREGYDAESNPVRDIREWSEKTKTDPRFVLTANWRKHEKSLEEIIDSLLQGEGEDVVEMARRKVHHALNNAIDGLSDVVRGVYRDAPVKKCYSKILSRELAAYLQSLGTSVLDSMKADLNEATAEASSDVRRQWDCHLQREVNKAVARVFLSEAAAVLLGQRQLSDSVYRAFDERRQE